MKYRGVVFDFDGTLLDTLRDLADSVNAVLGRSGFPQHSLDEYRHFVGEGIEDLRDFDPKEFVDALFDE